MVAAEKRGRVKTQSMAYYKARRRRLLIAVLPFALFVFAFSYVPILGWFISFVDYIPGVPVLRQTFAGFKYYGLVFSSGSQMLLALRNTLILGGLGLLASPAPAVFAMLLGEIRNRLFSRVVQTFSTFPNFFSWVIVYAIFYSVFSTQDGVLNVILLRLGLISRPTDVLINCDFAWINQTLIGIYKSAGFGAIIYIAAITGIDPELYDAASVDGANRLGKAWHITVPSLIPTYVVLLVLSLGNLLSAGGFEQYYVFANPFTIERLDVIDTYTYKVGILQSNYSYATAVGLMKSVVSIVLVFTSNFIMKRVSGRAIF